jgi:hypothetical protein
MSCAGAVELTSDEGQISSNKTLIDYNGQSFGRRKDEAHVGGIVPLSGSGRFYSSDPSE